ncbi:MAG: FecR domain-containing protein [Mangrovibacterium sp.]|nr:FecR domain-containing protein [Mangrovibacterium sp.]
MLGETGYHFLQKQNDASPASGLVEDTTPYGSKTQLKLLDGSRVWLNAGTTLKCDQEFGSKNRNIRLSGEAYFEVARNANLPFTVQAKEIVVKVLFNVDHNNFSLSDIANTSEVSWITDNWVIKNMNMDELAKLLQRRYNLSFIFTDEKIKGYEFGGTINDADANVVVAQLLYLNSVDSGRGVDLYIHSPGGSLSSDGQANRPQLERD